MPVCRFCDDPASLFALTACRGDPKSTRSWRRLVLPLCPRCHRLLAVAGAEGRKLKGTGERWWMGHGVGRFESKGGTATASGALVIG